MAKTVTTAEAALPPVEMFLSYSHKDEVLRAQLQDFLAPLAREGVAVHWDDRKIDPGEKWGNKINEHLNSADVILLLISSGFVASDYCYVTERQRAMQRYEAGEAEVVPIIVEPCDWEKLPVGDLQVVPEGAKPVTKWDNRAEAWTSVAKGIRKVVDKVRVRPRTSAAAPALTAVTKPQKDRILPPVWNVPHLRNRNFEGRESVLTNLHGALASGGAAALTQAITGLGGVGKTQTAIEFAYRYSGDYELVWWIRSEEPAKLASDYAGLAKPLGLKEEQELNVTVQAVRAELAKREGWLLVFDNANNPAEVRDYLPLAGDGHVLITSRNHDWSEVAEPLPITTWQRDESVAFLLKRVGESKSPPSFRQEREKKDGAPPSRSLASSASLTSTSSANDVAEALGDLPLALEQAAANIIASGGTLAGYLKTLREHTREVLRRGKAPAGYNATVATTWEISFREVEEESEAAAQLMNLCAFLAPDDIGREMLQAGAKYLPEPLAAAVADDLRWDDAVAVLRKYSLMQTQDGGLSVHRLVQAVVRDRLDEDERRWAETAVKAMDAAFPFESDDVQTWADCSRLLPHALAASEHAEKLQVGLKSCSILLNQVGGYLRERAELPGAESICIRALKISETIYGPDHPAVASGANSLGSVLHAQGDLAGARSSFERALKIDETNHGPDHPATALRVNNLGLVLHEQGYLTEARLCFERALKISEAAYGPDHPTVAIRVGNLGLVLDGQGHLAEARACFERALEITEAAYGPDHRHVAVYLDNLGNVLRDQGDLAGARACIERALRITEDVYGPDHPAVAVRVNNLGGVLKRQGDLAGARACFERAMTIQAEFAPDHPYMARALNNLGGVLRDQGDFVGARGYVERALKIDEKAYGLDHPQVAQHLSNLGFILRDLGDMAGARQCYERALKIFERALSKGHPKMQLVRQSLEELG